MKKVLCVLLAALMMAAMFGCSGSGEGDAAAEGVAKTVLDNKAMTVEELIA